jgi:hypothetical protein
MSQDLISVGKAADSVDAGTGALLVFAGKIGTGVAVLILVLSMFAFMSSGRLAGMLLCIASALGYFIFAGDAVAMGLPFLGAVLCIAGGGRRVTMGSNYS